MKDEGPRYLCNLCNRLLDSQEELLEHFRTVHHLNEPPGSQTPPMRGSRQDGAWRYGRRKDDERRLKI